MNQKEKILYGIVAVLCASQLIVLWSVFHSPAGQPAGLGQAPAGAAMPPGMEASTTPPAPPGSKLVLIRGKVQAVNGQTLTISTSEDGSVAKVQVAPATKIVKTDGSQKDPEAQKADLEAYNAKAAELSKDQAKNKSAIETLVPPNPFVEKPIQLSDMQAGDSVTVFSFSKNSDGSYAAQQIVVLVSSDAFKAAQ
jgi:hypothetical protein